jgi:hypothetical protein
MRRHRVGRVAVTAGIALAIAACTTTYTDDELPEEGREEAEAAQSEEEYDEAVTERGGENAKALEDEAEWNWEDANR